MTAASGRSDDPCLSLPPLPQARRPLTPPQGPPQAAQHLPGDLPQSPEVLPPRAAARELVTSEVQVGKEYPAGGVRSQGCVGQTKHERKSYSFAAASGLSRGRIHGGGSSPHPAQPSSGPKADLPPPHPRGQRGCASRASASPELSWGPIGPDPGPTCRVSICRCGRELGFVSCSQVTRSHPGPHHRVGREFHLS